MRKASFEICCRRSETAQPCIGPNPRVLRMSKSRVPCGRSNRSIYPSRFDKKSVYRSPIELQARSPDPQRTYGSTQYMIFLDDPPYASRDYRVLPVCGAHVYSE